MLAETTLTPRLAVFTLGGDTALTSYGANCVALAGGTGTLLVDPLIAPPHAAQVAAALDRRGFPAVTHVVVPHHHTDHALGPEIVDAQSRYHAAVQRTIAAADSRADARVAIRGQFPGFELLLAIESALDRWPSPWGQT